MKSKKDSILVLSGGMDSTTMLYQYADRIELAVSFNYGSNHNAREIAYAAENCRRLRIQHLVIPLDFIARDFTSSLLSGAKDIPEGRYDSENMKSTVVPFRNGIMLAVAAGLAESHGLKYVMIANHYGDHTIYPDCTRPFIDSMSDAVKNGTFNAVTILAPYTDISKTEVARIGKKLGLDYSLTYSCYKGGEKHCGKCGTCIERREALRDAGIEDTTLYEDDAAPLD